MTIFRRSLIFVAAIVTCMAGVVSCRSLPEAQGDLGDNIESIYMESVRIEDFPNQNHEIAVQMEFSAALDFWELVVVHARRNGRDSTLSLLNQIFETHGAATVIVSWQGRHFIDDETLQSWLSRTSLKRTKRFELLVGNPIDWSKVNKVRSAVPRDGLTKKLWEWPPANSSDFKSIKAREALGFPGPKHFGGAIFRH